MKINKFLFSTLIAAAAMTSTARAEDLVVSANHTVRKDKTEVYDSVTVNAANLHVYGSLTANTMTTNSNVNIYAGGSLTVNDSCEINSNVKLATSSRYANDVNVIINGTLKNAKGSIIAYNTNLTAENIVDDNLNGGSFSFNQDSVVTVKEDFKVEAATISFKTGSTLDVQGIFSVGKNTSAGSAVWFTDSTLKAGGVTYDSFDSVKFTLNNSNATVEGDFSITKGVVVLKDSELNAATLTNYGTVTVEGNSSISAASIIGNKIVVTNGATLTLSASSLLDFVDNTKGGTVLFEKVDSRVSLGNDSAPLTIGTSEKGTVQLSTKSGNVVVNKAEQIATSDVEISVEGVVVENVLAAWSFDVENGDSGVTVTMDVGENVDVSTIKIFHREDSNSAWEDYTDIVSDITLVDGKLTFTATSFSDYTAVETVAAPEPSAFGLLAGLGALALVASRRRRK